MAEPGFEPEPLETEHVCPPQLCPHPADRGRTGLRTHQVPSAWTRQSLFQALNPMTAGAHHSVDANAKRAGTRSPDLSSTCALCWRRRENCDQRRQRPARPNFIHSCSGTHMLHQARRPRVRAPRVGELNDPHALNCIAREGSGVKERDGERCT